MIFFLHTTHCSTPPTAQYRSSTYPCTWYCTSITTLDAWRAQLRRKGDTACPCVRQQTSVLLFEQLMTPNQNLTTRIWDVAWQMRLITWIMMFAVSKMDCWCRLEQHNVCGIVIIRVFRYGEKLQGLRAYSDGCNRQFRRLPSVIIHHSVANISSAHLHLEFEFPTIFFVT